MAKISVKKSETLKTVLLSESRSFNSSDRLAKTKSDSENNTDEKFQNDICYFLGSNWNISIYDIHSDISFSS